MRWRCLALARTVRCSCRPAHGWYYHFWSYTQTCLEEHTCQLLSAQILTWEYVSQSVGAVILAKFCKQTKSRAYLVSSSVLSTGCSSMSKYQESKFIALRLWRLSRVENRHLNFSRYAVENCCRLVTWLGICRCLVFP